MNRSITFSPIGYVVSPEKEAVDADWEEMISTISLLPEYHGGLEGLELFSHAFVLTYLHKAAKYRPEAHLRRHPRGLASLPLVGIFARRAKERPNPIGITVVKVVRVGTHELEVQGLDAIDGTPVLDIKPYFPIHDSAENAVIPQWISELTEGSPCASDLPSHHRSV